MDVWGNSLYKLADMEATDSSQLQTLTQIFVNIVIKVC